MIGIFDSGIGGLSLYKKAKSKMPDKGFLYLADQASFPYGEKTEEELLSLVRKNIEILQGRGAKVVLIACNSATVSSRGRIRKEFDMPVVGVEPGIKVAHDLFPDKKLVVLATERTVKSHVDSKKNEYKDTRVVAANGLVDLIEKKFPNISENDLKDILDTKINKEEVVVLGCTHYHLIRTMLEKIYPEKIFIAPEEAIIKQLEKYSDFGDERTDDIFLTTGDLTDFRVKLEAFLGRKCDVKKV